MRDQTQSYIAAAPRSSEEIEHIVVMERLHRYNHGLPCGADALYQHLRDEPGMQPMPSARCIHRILTLYGLTHGRTGWYEGEELDWLPESARVPETRRKHYSVDIYLQQASEQCIRTSTAG